MFVFGAEWGGGARFLQFLACMYLAQIVVSPISQTLFIFEQQGIQCVWDLARVSTVIMVFLLARALAWPPLTAIAVLSFVTTACYAALFLLARWAILRAQRT